MLASHQSLRLHASQIWRFAVCGGTGFVIDLLSLGFFVEYFGIDPRIGLLAVSGMETSLFLFLIALILIITFNDFLRVF